MRFKLSLCHWLCLTAAMKINMRGEGLSGSGRQWTLYIEYCTELTYITVVRWLEQRDTDPEVVISSPGQDRTLILIFLYLSKIQLSMMIGSSSETNLNRYISVYIVIAPLLVSVKMKFEQLTPNFCHMIRVKA